MPTRAFNFSSLLMIPVAFIGCSDTANESFGSRPQKLASVSNSFVGTWGPGPGYVANDWTVSFSKTGVVSVDGPGMTASGSYTPHGKKARAVYSYRGANQPTNANLKFGRFELSDDNAEITFETGLPNDPPVHLVRVR